MPCCMIETAAQAACISILTRKELTAFRVEGVTRNLSSTACQKHKHCPSFKEKKTHVPK